VELILRMARFFTAARVAGLQGEGVVDQRDVIASGKGSVILENRIFKHPTMHVVLLRDHVFLTVVRGRELLLEASVAVVAVYVVNVGLYQGATINTITVGRVNQFRYNT
jgi:hypothetical protein